MLGAPFLNLKKITSNSNLSTPVPIFGMFGKLNITIRILKKRVKSPFTYIETGNPDMPNLKKQYHVILERGQVRATNCNRKLYAYKVGMDMSVWVGVFASHPNLQCKYGANIYIHAEAKSRGYSNFG